MRGGIWVLNVFAAIWCCAAIRLGGAASLLMLVPIALSAALLWQATRLTWPTRSEDQEKRVGRVVGIWSAVEGVVMFVVANVLINLHLRDAIMPAFAIVVGAHFFPLARGIPVPLYYVTGAGLVAIGLAGLALTPPLAFLVTGIGAAVILWISAVGLMSGARA